MSREGRARSRLRRRSAGLSALSAGVLAAAAFVAAACGSRSAVVEVPDPAPRDGGSAMDGGGELPVVDASGGGPRNTCYAVLGEANVPCAFKPGSRTEAACAATLDCEGHLYTVACEAGQCTCENVGFNRCFCRGVQSGLEACGATNCCWQ